MRRLLPLIGLISLAACKGESAPGTPAAPGSRSDAATRALVTPDSSLDRAAPDSFAITMTTSAGEVEIVVHRAWAPRGAARLHWLASHGFFDDARFFRVLTGFVAQFGLSGVPAIDKAWTTRTFPDDAVKHSNKRGTIVFATAGPNTRTTQLFINVADNANLDGMGFAPLGEVRRGMDVVDRLYAGYGDGAPSGAGPDQEAIKNQGNPYLIGAWPKLDRIVKTAVAPLGAAR